MFSLCPKLEAGDHRTLAGPFALKRLYALAGVTLRETFEKLMGRDKIFLPLAGHMHFQCLAAAVRLDLFTLLDGSAPLTVAQIAEKLGIEQHPCKVLLLGCAAMGLLQSRRGLYANSRNASRYFSRKRPAHICALVEWHEKLAYKPMSYFYESLQANTNVGLCEFAGDEKTVYERLGHIPEGEVVFQQAMQALSKQSNGAFADCVDFSNIKTIVDVGGGNGSNLIRLTRKHPHLKGVVFDLPSVCVVARENIRQENACDRVSTIAGDCFVDPFPAGADCFLFSHFCSQWSETKDRLLFKKAYAALPVGGKVMVFSMLQNDNGDGPLPATLFSPWFLTIASGEGMINSGSDYEGWLRDAGFSKVERQKLLFHNAAIIATKL